MVEQTSTCETTQLDFSLQICDGTFLRKCRICGNPTFLFPLQIVHRDGTTLCKDHVEKHAYNLHAALQLYNNRYRNYLRKITTYTGQVYTLVIGMNGTTHTTPEVDLLLSETGTFLSIMSDQYEISSLYCMPQYEKDSIGGIKYKNEHSFHSEDTEYILYKAARFLNPYVINYILMIDSEILDIDNEWKILIRQTMHT